jgi:hypothetical protein
MSRSSLPHWDVSTMRHQPSYSPGMSTSDATCRPHQREGADVLGGGHPNLTNVDDVPTERRQLRGRRARQPLVEQQLHALLGSSTTLSSSDAAA